MKRFFKGFRKSSKNAGDKRSKSYQKQLQSPTASVPGEAPVVRPPSSMDLDTLYTSNTPKSRPGGSQQHMDSATVISGISASSGNRVTTIKERVPAPETSSGGGPVPPPAAGQPTSGEQDPKQSTTDLTRDLVKRFIADIWNRGEVDLIPEVCSPSLRFNGNTGFDRVGHDGLARMVATIRDALDDYHCEIHAMVVEHNKAFCRLRFTGKHTGNLLGYPPTGKVVAWMGATEFTCQNGMILKVWELGDIKTLEEQLNTVGATSPEEPTET